MAKMGRPATVRNGRRVYAWVDGEIADAVEAIAKATGQTESTVIRNALSFYFQIRPHATASSVAAKEGDAA